MDHSFSTPSRYNTIPLDCKRPSVHDTKRLTQSYFMISSCPDHFNNNTEIVRRCEGTEHDNDYRRFQPVTSLISNETFRNLDCALCNQERVGSVLAWEPKLMCETADEILQINTEGELQKRLFASPPLCHMDFLPLSNVLRDRAKKCTQEDRMIKQCMFRTEWWEYDADIERGCYMDYIDPYTFCLPNKLHFTYKNVFCAMCNVKNWTTDLMTECPEENIIHNGMLSFSALIDFSGVYPKQHNQQKECPDQYIFDPLMVSTYIQYPCARVASILN